MGQPVTAGNVQPVIDGNSQVQDPLNGSGTASGTYTAGQSSDTVQINYLGAQGFNPSTAQITVPVNNPQPQNTQVAINVSPATPNPDDTVTWTAVVTTTP